MSKGASPAVTDDKKWEAESDARSLTESEQIRADKPRHARAIVELRKQAEVADKEAKIKRGLAAAFPKDK